MERSKKKVQMWKKAIVHFLLCFVMGFFTGFAPSGKASIYSTFAAIKNPAFSPQPLEMVHLMHNQSWNANALNESSPAPPKLESHGPIDHAKILREEKRSADLIQRDLVITVTPTSSKDHHRGPHLKRLASTLRLVAPPLLWVVLEQQSESSEVSEILRRTGIMYRHLVFKENFTNIQDEMDHQRNIALKHIEHHKLSGIVHFAGLSSVYDLSFFEKIRASRVFGTWPVAFLSANRKEVDIQGPICDSSKVVGWHLKNLNSSTMDIKPSSIHISSFGFNSSILWDPERWGRTSPIQDNSQDSLKIVEKEVLEEETNLKGIPGEEDCSKVLVWHLKTSF